MRHGNKLVESDWAAPLEERFSVSQVQQLDELHVAHETLPSFLNEVGRCLSDFLFLERFFHGSLIV